MAKDIRKLLEEDNKLVVDSMPQGHESRFLNKLDKALPVKKKQQFHWWSIAASVVLLIGLGFGGYHYFKPEQAIEVVETNETDVKTKTIGDISPDLKKVEDYYLANINLELSKVKLTPENKDLFDGYVKQLDALKAEYKRLNIELTNEGPNELTVDALISNLKLRLNLMYRLKEQLKDLNTVNSNRI
ncbi:hypothetical protein [Lacinutrix chionoecetis]